MEAPPDYDFNFIRENIDRASSSIVSSPPGTVQIPFVVLLATGGMNPVHKGHISMLHRVAQSPSWQGKGTIVGAFLSPSNDLYLREKFGDGNFFPAKMRVEMVHAATQHSSLIRVGRWETSVTHHRRWPDFPEVAKHLEKSLKAEFSSHPIQVWYVCGEDHYSKCHLHN